MIPVLLKIKGLYSFQREQVIDFNKLIDAQIFGIFGTVGSGKSTILEAISFSLFGNTERLNLRDNRNYNMMNLKSDELMIDFEFNNFDGETYRFQVKGKRNGAEFSKVNSFQRSAYKKQGNEWIPLGGITAEEILGLSYENFRRTIIIPQGQFQEFLELGDKDRTNMLKELFHLGKYDFFYQTTSLEKKNNEQIQYLNGQLAQFEGTTKEIIEEKEAAVKLISDELANLRKELETVKAKEKEQSELKKTAEELKAKREILAKLIQDEPQILAQEKILGQYESCAQLFKNQLAAQKEIEKSRQEKNDSLKLNTENLHLLEEELEKNQARFESVQLEFGKLDQKKQEISDHRQLVIIQKLHAEIGELEKRISAGEIKLKSEEAIKAEFQIKADTAKKSIHKEKEMLPDLAELAEIKTWFAEKSGMMRNIVSANAGKTQYEDQLKEKKRTVSLQIPAQIKADYPFSNEDKIEDYVEKLEKQKVLNATKSETIIAINNHLLLQEKLEEFTQRLHDNEPCPLCGSLDHPDIMRVENVKEAMRANDEKLDNVRKESMAIEDTVQYLNQCLYEQNALTKQIQASDLKLREETEIQKNHLLKFRWKAYDLNDEEAFNQVFEKARTASNSISVMEKELEKVEKDLEKAEQNFESYKMLLSEIQNLHTIRKTEAETISAQIKSFDPAGISLETDAVNMKISALENEVKTITENHEALAKKIIDQNQQKVILKERIQAAQDSMAEYAEQLEKLNAELSENLMKSEFSHLDEVAALLSREIDPKALRKEIDQFNQSLFKSKADVAELEKSMEGKPFIAEAYAELAELMKSLETIVQAKNDLYVTEASMLNKLKVDFEKKETLLHEFESLGRRAENISLMKGLFKGSGFVNYISTVYLQNLCEAANVRFYKLTRQQLRLEITESNDFQVRDYLNDGKVRSIKTLSGGQIFQAALSLALALAESIQQQNRAKQNFFFLDEGFGSQDKLSLQIVFESLKSLREENRIIGVISHVEDLQQEIDMYLELENDPETGSRIVQSWEN